MGGSTHGSSGTNSGNDVLILPNDIVNLVGKNTGRLENEKVVSLTI